jgi:hypothetical protein
MKFNLIKIEIKNVSIDDIKYYSKYLSTFGRKKGSTYFYSSVGAESQSDTRLLLIFKILNYGILLPKQNIT